MLDQAPGHRRESATDRNADTPLASQASMDQTDAQQDCSDIDVDVISDDDDDDEDLKVSPRSESPRGQYMEDVDNICSKVSTLMPTEIKQSI